MTEELIGFRYVFEFAAFPGRHDVDIYMTDEKEAYKAARAKVAVTYGFLNVGESLVEVQKITGINPDSYDW